MTPDLNNDIAILILAAGGSTRFGSIKQVASFDGETLLRRAINTALAATKDVFVVLGNQSEQLKTECAGAAILDNRNWKDGIGSSIRIGIQELTCFSGALIMLADQPLITFDSINRLREEFLINPSKIIASRYLDTLGTPAIFPKLFFPDLRSLIGDQGAKAIITKNVNKANLIEMPEAAYDIDRPKDLDDIKLQLPSPKFIPSQK